MNLLPEMKSKMEMVEVGRKRLASGLYLVYLCTGSSTLVVIAQLGTAGGLGTLQGML